MWIVICALALILLAVWEIWVCEGAHLGRRFVVRMYDLAAGRYDGIKQFDPDWEARFVGEPLAASLQGMPAARLLDVGAGTGRVARALLPQLDPDRSPLLVNLEPSRRMLALGAQHTGRLAWWVCGWAVPLPFADASFDLVVSLEVLEFTPNPSASLGEMQRVLRPGGLLLITNRIGWEAPLILGHTRSKQGFQRMLEQAELEVIEVYPWQMDYDLAWARKPLEPI